MLIAAIQMYWILSFGALLSEKTVLTTSLNVLTLVFMNFHHK